MRGLAHAGFTFISGSNFGGVGFDSAERCQNNHLARQRATRQGPAIQSALIWLRGTYQRDSALLWFSLDGQNYIDTNSTGRLQYLNLKGARFGMFCFGGAAENAGCADVDFVYYEYGAVAQP